MLHTKTSGVDVDEALRCMSLLRQRLDQSGPSKINLLSAVSGTRHRLVECRVRKLVCHLSVTCMYTVLCS